MPDFKLCKRLVCSPFDNCSCDLRATTEVVGDDAAIKRGFEHIERSQSTQSIRLLNLELAYTRFEEIAANLGVTVDDIINVQTKTPSVGADGL